MTPLPLLADPDALKLESIVPRHENVTLVVRSIQKASRCPCCGQASTRVHSRYQRFPNDLPWQGVPVTLKLNVRRFFCTDPTCRRRIFCERFDTAFVPFARQTLRLGKATQALGFSLGGEAGTRTAERLGIPSSADTLLRRIRQSPVPALEESPRVIGVDDWAYCKGQRYGTLIVDLEGYSGPGVLACRVYRENGGKGWPSKTLLERALVAAKLPSKARR